MTNIISLDSKRWENNNNYYTTPGQHNFAWLQPGNVSEADALTVSQAILLQPMLVAWHIDISTTELVEEMQQVKISGWRGMFNRRLKSIPFTQIAPGSQVEDVERTLKRIGAGSTIFERYAWSSWRKQRSLFELSTVL